jgi:HD-GYP domain-containing protein (c-di-GMP phosphodiesterase class II)
MRDVARTRSGGQFDPSVVDLFLQNVNDLLAGFGATPEWDLFLATEPGQSIEVVPGQFRTIAMAFADFVDNKSPWFLGHSRRVSALAFGAAIGIGLSEADSQDVFDAGLVHDIGKCAIANGIWDKTAALSEYEEAEAQTHCFHTDKILAMAGVFSSIRALASSVHERCDGSGYHRRIHLTGSGACLLAAANLYDELTHDQAGRPALPKTEARDLMLAEAQAKRLPAECVKAVLEFAGHDTAGSTATPDGLTRREVDVLVEIAKGHSNRSTADRLGIAPKTVDKHTENLYRKIGVSSRTAAALYAMENGLLGER